MRVRSTVIETIDSFDLLAGMGADMTLSLVNVLLVATAIVAAHGLILLPATRKWLETAPHRRKQALATLVLMLEISQMIATAALVSAAATWIALSALMMISGGASSDSVAKAIETIRAVRALAANSELAVAASAFLLSGAGLVWWILRRRKAQFEVAQRTAIAHQFSQLVDRFNDGSLPPIEPTGSMKEAMTRIAAHSQHIESLKDQLREATENGEVDRVATVSASIETTEHRRDQIFQELVHEDLARRIEVPEYDPDMIATPPPARSLLQKLGRIFVSRGMFRQLNLGQRGLLLLNVVLLVPSLLTWTSESIAGDLSAKLTQLDQLRISLVGQEAQARLAAVAVKLPDATSASDDERGVVNAAYAHARAFEISAGRRLETQFGLPHQAPSEELAASLRRETARRQVLETAAARVNADRQIVAGVETDRPPSGRRVEVLAPRPAADELPIGALSDRLSAARLDGRPHALTPAGESFAQEAVARAKSEPAFRARLVESARSTAASFLEAARPSQLRAAFLAAALSGGADAGAMHAAVAEPIAQWASGTVDVAARAGTYRVTAPTYLATLMETGDPAAAMRAVETMRQSPLLEAELNVVRSKLSPILRSDADARGLVERIAPGLVETSDGLVNAKLRDEALDSYFRVVTANQKGRLSIDRLNGLIAEAPVRSNFESYFPAQATEHSAGGGFGGGGIGSGPKGSPAAPRGGPLRTASAAARARSFVSLRGFSRVGGVLIGQDPQKSEGLDVREFRWTSDREGVQLTVVDSAGRATSLGPYHPAIVNLALAYAADGRVLTATMTKAEPLYELRILLHPTLVDTGVGCRAIEIDRFVDEAGSQFPTLRDARNRLTAWVQVQRFFYAMARAELVKAIYPDKEDADTLVRYDQDALKPIGEQDPFLISVADQASKTPAHIFDSAYSPLTTKSEFFHPIVVELLRECVTPDATGVSYLASCLRDKAAARRSSVGAQLLAEANLNWTAPTPTFEPWSGVRERSYSIDANLTFAGAGVKGGQPPDPFDFIYQLAFTSPPFAAMKTAWFKTRESSEADDIAPWLFDERELHIADNVVSLIARDPEKQAIFSDMRQFVWLQRLFRMAFSGSLGAQFPLQSLSLLAAETSASVKPQRTLRWNVRSAPELSLVQELGSEYKSLADSAKAEVRTCLKSIGYDPDRTNYSDAAAAAMTTTAKLYALSDDEWDKSCTFKSEMVPTLARTSQIVSSLRRLRHAMGVRDDEAMVAGRKARCAPL